MSVGFEQKLCIVLEPDDPDAKKFWVLYDNDGHAVGQCPKEDGPGLVRLQTTLENMEREI